MERQPGIGLESGDKQERGTQGQDHKGTNGYHRLVGVVPRGSLPRGGMGVWVSGKKGNLRAVEICVTRKSGFLRLRTPTLGAFKMW